MKHDFWCWPASELNDIVLPHVAFTSRMSSFRLNSSNNFTISLQSIFFHFFMHNLGLYIPNACEQYCSPQRPLQPSFYSILKSPLLFPVSFMPTLKASFFLIFAVQETRIPHTYDEPSLLNFPAWCVGALTVQWCIVSALSGRGKCLTKGQCVWEYSQSQNSVLFQSVMLF